MKYKLITNVDEIGFNNSVTTYLNNGWELHGSPFAVRQGREMCQAVKKVEAVKKPTVSSNKGK